MRPPHLLATDEADPKHSQITTAKKKEAQHAGEQQRERERRLARPARTPPREGTPKARKGQRRRREEARAEAAQWQTPGGGTAAARRSTAAPSARGVRRRALLAPTGWHEEGQGLARAPARRSSIAAWPRATATASRCLTSARASAQILPQVAGAWARKGARSSAPMRPPDSRTAARRQGKGNACASEAPVAETKRLGRGSESASRRRR